MIVNTERPPAPERIPVSEYIPAPDVQEADRLWDLLVRGLLLVLVLSLCGVIYTVADGSDRTSPDVLVTVFTAALTGLIGLFVRTPG